MRKRLFQSVVGLGVIATLGMLGMPVANANTPSGQVAGWFGSTPTFTTATARFAVPTVTCPASGNHAYDLGVSWGAGDECDGVQPRGPHPHARAHQPTVIHRRRLPPRLRDVLVTPRHRKLRALNMK